MIYILRKKSMVGIWPYAGPACSQAGVSEGKYYYSLDEALDDCAKLDKFNPGEFDVVLLTPTVVSGFCEHHGLASFTEPDEKGNRYCGECVFK